MLFLFIYLFIFTNIYSYLLTIIDNYHHQVTFLHQEDLDPDLEKIEVPQKTDPIQR